MIFYVAISAFVVMTLFIVCSIYYQKFLFLVVPLMFLGLFTAATFIPNYQGYAVEEEFVGVRQAVLLSMNETKEWLFLFVQFRGESEPRLVKLANTEQNKKDAEDAQKEQKAGGLALVQFGHMKGGGKGSKNGDDHQMQLLQLSEIPELAKTQ